MFIKVSIVRRIANRYCSLVTMELNRNQFVDLDEQRPIKRSAPVTQTHFIKIEHLSAKVLKCWHYFFEINPYIFFHTHRNSNTLSFFLFSIFSRHMWHSDIWRLNQYLEWYKNSYKRDIIKCRGEILKILERRFNFG